MNGTNVWVQGGGGITEGISSGPLFVDNGNGQVGSEAVCRRHLLKEWGEGGRESGEVDGCSRKKRNEMNEEPREGL